jgi:hypothetical protein
MPAATSTHQCSQGKWQRGRVLTSTTKAKMVSAFVAKDGKFAQIDDHQCSASAGSTATAAVKMMS